MGAILAAFTTDVLKWAHDMSTLPMSTQIWATLYPLPQVILGGASIIFIGATSVGALYFYSRIASAIVAGQVHKHKPFSKLIGPIMHALFYIFLLPHAVVWLTHNKPLENDTLEVKIHYWFVLYTTCITALSCVLDTEPLLKFLQGKDPGVYKRVDSTDQ